MTANSSLACRLIGARPTLTAGAESLAAVNTELLDDGCLAYVAEAGCHFVLTRASSAAADGRTVVQPSAGPGRWTIGRGWTSNAAAGRVPFWYVDESGLDTNTGQSPDSPFPSTERLGQALCPGGTECVIEQQTVISIGAGTLGDITLNLGFPAGISVFAFGVEILGTARASVVTVSAATTTAPAASGGVRGQVATAAGTFVNKLRMQSPPGSYASGAGLLAFSTGLNGDAQHTFCGNWIDTHGHAANPPHVGAEVSIDTVLTSVSTWNITTHGKGYVYVQDVAFVGSGTLASDYISSNNDNMLTLAGCELGGSFDEVRADFIACRTIAPTFFNGGKPRFFGCDFQDAAQFQFGCYPNFRNGNVVDAGSWTLASTASALSVNFVEFCNGAPGLTAIRVLTGCFYANQNLLWGASTPYGTGVAISSGAGFTTSALANVAIPATIPVNLTGHTVAYSAASAVSRAGAFYAVDPDPTATVTTT